MFPSAEWAEVTVVQNFAGPRLRDTRAWRQPPPASPSVIQTTIVLVMDESLLRPHNFRRIIINPMKISDLVFIGIKGSVVALDRTTGQQAWATHLKGMDFVNVHLVDGAVLASCYGEIFCLDPLTGAALWHNPLKGFGRGLATMATEHHRGTGTSPLLAEKQRRDAAAASAAATCA